MNPDRRNGHGPNLAGAVLIPDPRDQTKVQPVITDYAEKARDWPFADQLRFANRWSDIFDERLLDSVAVPGKPRIPRPVIGFEPMRVETLAAYTINRDNHGLLHAVNFNEVHFLDTDEGKQWRYGQWGFLETLLHEKLHLWQQELGQHPYKQGSNTHNAEFCAKAESYGLHPLPVIGCHIAPADGIFAALMKEYGIERPQAEIPDGSKVDWWKLFPDLFKAPPKGRSSLTKWTCEGCGLNLRVGVKTDIEVACMPCSREAGHTVLFKRS